MSNESAKPAARPEGQEVPEKVDVELNLDELDNVNGGAGIGGAIRAPRPPVSPSPTEPVSPESPGGIFQIEAI